MHAGRAACCFLLSYGEYVDGTDRRTDGRQTVSLRFPQLDAVKVIKDSKLLIYFLFQDVAVELQALIITMR